MPTLSGARARASPRYRLQGDVDGGMEGRTGRAGSRVHRVALADHHDVAGECVRVGPRRQFALLDGAWLVVAAAVFFAVLIVGRRKRRGSQLLETPDKLTLEHKATLEAPRSTQWFGRMGH